MNRDFKGVIVEESLEDRSVLGGLEVVRVRETDDENPDDRWHLHTVRVSENDVEACARAMKPGWYMHFWKGSEMIVAFRDKRFRIDMNDKSTWEDAVAYGLSQGIPAEQLDFEIEE